jgi:AmmeMemoRadiSam system protein B/AmmeMemoRadiSam system protein A
MERVKTSSEKRAGFEGPRVRGAKENPVTTETLVQDAGLIKHVTHYAHVPMQTGSRVTGCQLKFAMLFLAILLLSPFVCQGDNTALTVRKPVFAGSFYPADKASLSNLIDSYLKEAGQKSKKVDGQIFGIITPHAGYEYSGRVAAYAYSQIKSKEYRTVIIIGSSHRVPFRGIAIYPEGSWETPLGTVAIDHEMAQVILKECKIIKPFSTAFEREHSLEVQVPFLQKALAGFKIVPIVTGSMDKNDYKDFADTLGRIVKNNRGKVLIVASSDMSHFHAYDAASKMDNLTLKDIGEMNVDSLHQHLQKGDCELCGAQGVLSLMMLAKQMNGKATILNYANSGDVTNDKTRVVGYSSVAFTTLLYEQGLSWKEQEILLSIARKALEGSVKYGIIPATYVNEKNLLEKRGAFVTLTKNGSLRGCIGYIQPVTPLYKAVSDMAIAASARDPRFPPVAQGELKDIHIEISVLSPLRLIADTNEIEIGKHGLYMIRGGNTGLLLPQVATQQGWNREEFLRQICVKAGLPAQSWKDRETQIYTFSAQILSE